MGSCLLLNGGLVTPLTVSSVSVVNSQVIRNFYWQSVGRADVDKARVLLELLFVRLAFGELSSV